MPEMADENYFKQGQQKKKGPRIIGAIIIFLVILFFTIEFFIREEQQFSPTSVTNLLLSALQIIVLLLFLILFFVLGRNLIKLYLERKRKVIGAHFKTKLVMFFTALSLIPTLLLFLFASDLVSRNIENWFKTPFYKILDDTKSLADGVRQDSEDITLHYARQLCKSIKKQRLLSPGSQRPLREFIADKLREYKLDEIGVYLDGEEMFTYLDRNLPLRDYRPFKTGLLKSAEKEETFASVEPMSSGEIIRCGALSPAGDGGNILVVAGKFIPQNYAQSIHNINSYVEQYRQLKIQKNPVKTFYLITLIFITLLIIFAASWIGFHLAKAITVPIEKLAQATKEVSRGNLDVSVEDPASDELGILIDSFNQMISDLKESQSNIAQKTSELEARKRYTETILDDITTGVVALDAKGVITTINPSAHDMLALPRTSIVGKSYGDVLNHPRYADIIKNIQLGFQNEYKISDQEISIDFGDQESILSLTVSPLRQSGNKFSGLIIVLENLTQLIRAQKMAAWKEVAQRVAHEIKNPLTPIQLSAERILKKLKKNEADYDETIQEGAKTIIEETKAIKGLVDEFSNFARMPKIHIKSSDIHDIIEQTVSLFKGVFKNVEFSMKFSPDVPLLIRTDSEQMKRVFINIFENAIQAMNSSGEIKIETSFDKETKKVRIEVADSGRGISLKDKDKLFLPTFSTKKKGGGLGLAIVSQILSEHNGSVDVQNNYPHGAKFIIHLPL